MVDNSFQNKVMNAAKWSTITEIIAKIVSPITNMILARVLIPEVFGIVATVTMILTFADMFTDAGFQKYLIQHKFNDEDEKYRYANVAFWTNLAISAFLWGTIIVFRDQIAVLVGNPSLGNVVAISCVQLILSSFSSIQTALFRRDFDFKTLFLVRLILVFIPATITIPLAFLGFSYWSLIIGSIFTQLLNATILTVKSRWKPKMYYNFEILKEMFSFSVWSLLEAISIWFTVWIDVFIVGSSFSQYYLGLYTTSKTMINSLMGLITAATIPVLFSALSRLKHDNGQFENMFFHTQRLVSIIVIPLGVGIYVYRDLVTMVLLGSQWSEASGVIGIFGLSTSMIVVFGYYCSEVYRAKGKPKLSFFAQLLYLSFFVPICTISARYGFWTMVYANALAIIAFILIHFIIMKIAMGISVFKMLKNVFPVLISAIPMGILSYFLQKLSKGLLWSFISIVICSLFYFGVLCLFPSMRKDINGIVKRLKLK